MSQDYHKENLTEETSTILSLVNDIYQLEEKIIDLKNSITAQNNSDAKDKEMDNLKKNKKELSKEMNQLSVNLLIDVSNKENVIKKKSYLLKELNKKINNYRSILTTYKTLSFNSPILKKYILSNKMNQFLTDEQIDDIMSKTQTLCKNDNLIQKIEKEFSVNKEQLNNINKSINKINCQINEIEENLQMMKEEKITFKNELVNYISSKETLESIIKMNLPSIISNKEEYLEDDNRSDSKNYEKNSFISKDVHSQNRANTINSITEEENENYNNNMGNSYLNTSFYGSNKNNFNNLNNKKSWDEMINLYPYEFYYLEPNKISTGICNEIFDLLNSKISNDNYRNSTAFEPQKSSNLLVKIKSSNVNNRYNIGNPLTFSCGSPIVKKTKVNLFLLNDILDMKKEIQQKTKVELQNFFKDIINNNKISIVNFIEKISDLIINKLSEIGFYLSKKNLMIYFSCFFKKSFYECMIAIKLKFINKDYKNIKKAKKKKIENLQDQLTKLNTKSETIQNTIILQESKLKLLNSNKDNIDKEKKSNKELIKFNNNNDANLNLSLEEQNYIQLCRKANSFINEKNEIEREIDEIKNDEKLNKYQGELKVNSLKNEIDELDSQINLLENDGFKKKAKSDEEIAECRKIIVDKFSIIKENLGKYKNKCSNDMNTYNKFIDDISTNIKSQYYKSLLDLEKCKTSNTETSTLSKIKNTDPKSTIENYNYTDFENENTNINNLTNSNFKSHRKTASDVGRPFTFGEDNFSPIHKHKDFLMNEFFNSTSKKNNIIYSSNRNRVKNNNYINIFDSCNNLNNYFFQFQTPSTIVNIDDNKRQGSYFMNNTNKHTRNQINILSYSSPYSASSKRTSSNNKFKSPKSNIKPTNLINNLKYCISDKKIVNDRNNANNLDNTSNTNNPNNTNITFKNINLDLTNIYNLYKDKPLTKKKINNSNLLSNLSRDKNSYAIINDSKSSQINSMFKKTFCYFRVLNNKNKKYNPLDNITMHELCSSPYNFIKSSLSFDKKEDMIKISPSNQLESLNIKIEKIESSTINSEMKIIIDIFRGFRKYKSLYDNDDINKYIKELKKGNISYNHLSEEEINKCCNNKNFIFSFYIKNKKGIELLFCSYEEFKLWNNTICFFIKNKNEFFSNLTSRKTFKYP